MGDTVTAEKIGELRGEVRALTERVTNIEDGVGDLRQSAGRIEGMLKGSVQSGPQPTMSTPSQSATEPQTATIGRFLNRHGVHVVYGIVVLVLGIACLAAYTGRDASSLVTYPTVSVPAKEGNGP